MEIIGMPRVTYHQVFDEDGLLKDGARVRVPMMFRDSMTPVQRAIYDARKQHGRNCDCEDCAAKYGARDDLEEDQLTAFIDSPQGQIGLHSPGFRFLTNNTAMSGADHARDVTAAKVKADARAEMIDAQASAYKRKGQYSEYSGGTEYSVYTGQPTRWIPTEPSGRYPLSAGENNRCTINGRGGKLRKSADGGCLICVPDGSTDAAPPRVMDSASAQLIRDQAADQYAAEQRDAWKRR
jgi:hypothetical protein